MRWTSWKYFGRIFGRNSIEGVMEETRIERQTKEEEEEEED